ATLLDDGKTLVPYGGTASGYINPDGEWVCRADLTPIDFDGNKLEKVPSSFDSDLTLDEEITAEEFLDHSIRLTYALKSDDMNKAFLKTLKDGVIYKTNFSYRGSVDPDPAFVMQGGDSTIWLLIGAENRVSYSKLEQAAIIESTAEKDEGAETSSDDLDFGML
ncbi:MAG: hypothetical protein V3U71_11045, partial [Cocleimonas sp.]